MEITYLTDDPARAYSDAIRSAATREALIAAIRPYRRVAADALYRAERLTLDDFMEFRAGLKYVAKANPVKGFERWASQFQDIILPRAMLEASMVSHQFHAPWGCAYIRLIEEKQLVEVDGCAYLGLPRRVPTKKREPTQ